MDIPPYFIMKKPILFFSIFLLKVVYICAIPACGTLLSVPQRDGTMLHIRQVGDEHFHFYLSSDYLFVTQDSANCWCYAKYQNGEFYSTQVLAHDANQRNAEETSFVERNVGMLDFKQQKNNICKLWEDRREQGNAKRISRQRKTLEHNTYYGERKGLVILVDFTNQKMKSTQSQELYYRMFNEFGYSDNNHVGSVSDFFRDQSYGKFNLTFDVVGPVSLPNTYGYYGTNGLNNPSGNDKKAHEMIHDACLLADKEVNFSDYDWDGDGEVDQVYVIYAGYGEATGGPSNTIWPHHSRLHYDYDESLVLDNVVIDEYACSNELYSHNNAYMGIGTACHEFSHCLGLPDLYDTDYTGAFGMGGWSIMDGGSYNGPMGLGEVPCGYTAFERYYVGWLDFVEVSSTIRIDGMRDIGVVPIAYKVQNGGNKNEFYTVEYRKGEKWFSYVKEIPNPHGLLITHIDYDSSAWIKNRVNPSTSHQRMSIIPADNHYSVNGEYSDWMGDLFPGYMSVSVMDDNSHIETGGKLFTPNLDGTYNMGITLNQITENSDGTASYNIIFNRELYAPHSIVVNDLFIIGFGISWEPVPTADSYTVELNWLVSKKPLVKKTEIFEDIKDTSFRFENLSDYKYNFRVRSNRDGISTEWSEYKSFDFKTQDVIDEINDIHADKNDIIYDIQGNRVCGNDKHGIYIIRRNGNYIKVLR